jgi:hypothetical protein
MKIDPTDPDLMQKELYSGGENHLIPDRQMLPDCGLKVFYRLVRRKIVKPIALLFFPVYF